MEINNEENNKENNKDENTQETLIIEENEINILNSNISDEFLLFQHNFLKNDLKKCLELVKTYILENELMIVGGMAIDLSLKVQNSQLYDEKFQIPDYDVISFDNVLHANNIGDILCKNKFKNIAIIPALHKTTVRVQISGYTLFDSTFVPKFIYNKLPFMKFENFKFIHPIYQKIDQYTSLSFLFEVTGPAYNITHRLKKDIIRKNILNQYYNLNINDIDTKDLKLYIKNCTIDFKNIKLNLNLFNNKTINKIKIFNTNKILYEKNNINIYEFNKYLDIDNNYINMLNNNDIFYSIDCDFTHHGVFAYSIMYKKFIDTIKDIKNKNFISKSHLDIINNLENEILIKNPISLYDEKNNIIQFKIPNNIPFVIINNNNNIYNIYDDLKQIYKIPQIVNFEGTSRSIPNYSSSNLKIDDIDINLQFFDLYGKLLAVDLVRIDNKLYHISNYNYNLSYFLFNYYMSNDQEIKNLYLSYYISLITIIKIFNFINTEYNEKIKENNIDINIFLYSINTLGFKNCSENYYYFIKNFNYLVKENKNLNDLPPKNYIGFPNCDIKKEFNKENSPFYNEFHKEIQNTNFHNNLKEITY
jgi:hypothetical protein